jgi:hypothetical protein
MLTSDNEPRQPSARSVIRPAFQVVGHENSFVRFNKKSGKGSILIFREIKSHYDVSLEQNGRKICNR